MVDNNNNQSSSKSLAILFGSLIIGLFILASGALQPTSVNVSPPFICDPGNESDCVNVTDGKLNTLIKNNVSQIIPSADLMTLCSFDLTIANCLEFTGHNPDVDNSGSMEDVWEGGGLLVYQTVAELQNISSTDPDDTAGGTGARTLFVQCLNENFTLVQEIVSLNGTTIVQTVNKCIRNRFVAVFTSGSSGFNEGIITLTSAVTGLLQVEMDEEEAFDKNSHFTVQAGHSAIIKKIMFSTTKSGGQSPIVEFKGKLRFFGSNTWTETFDFKIDTSINDHLIMENPFSNTITEKSDTRIEVTSSTDNVDVNTRIWIMEVPNEQILGTAKLLG